MNFDVSTDHEIFDNTEAVTVTLERSGGPEQIENVTVLRRALNRQEVLAAGGFLTGDETVFNIPSTELGTGKTIREGDRVTAGDEDWRVKAAGLLTFKSRWRAVCTLERS